MALRSAEQYIESLRDGRTVYYRGEQVKDVTTHPDIRVAIEHAAGDYQLAEDPRYKDLMTYQDPETGEISSRYFKIPRNAEDLLKRHEMILTGTRAGHGVVPIIKEIGTDAIFALYIIAKKMDDQLGSHYFERVQKYHQYCRQNDLSMATAQTDVKGDRGLRPSEQEHPDYYVRIVDETKDGIIVRGAKVHTTSAVAVNEILVIPTRALGEGDKNYAVAFAIPANTKGLKMIVSPFGSVPPSDFHHPVSTHHRLMESLTIFDDVFVPWERVFMKGEWQFAGPLATTFVQFHRFTAISYKPPLCELFVGAAELMAEANGVKKASHIREKITQLISYTETVRALTRASAYECRVVDPGIAVPDTIITNIAKYYFASHYHQAVSWLQDIAGGLLVTGPSEEDWLNPETRPYIQKYLGGAKEISTENRLKLFNLIRDLTASDFGGYHEVLAIHAEGSLEAQKITIYREYDTKPCIEFVKRVAQIRD